MARGSIKKHVAKDGTVSWRVRLDVPDPLSDHNRQCQRTFKTRTEAEAERRRWRAEIEPSLPGRARSPARRGPGLGLTLYFIAADTLSAIKIGVSRDVPDRLRQLQSECPARLRIAGLEPAGPDLALEVHLHMRFARLHMWGEWFRAEEPLLTYIAQETLGVTDYYRWRLGESAERFLAAHADVLGLAVDR